MLQSLPYQVILFVFLILGTQVLRMICVPSHLSPFLGFYFKSLAQLLICAGNCGPLASPSKHWAHYSCG